MQTARKLDGRPLKIAAIIALVAIVIGLGMHIEATARPDTGRQGQYIQGEADEH